MERLTNLAGQAMIQLAQQRRLQREQEPGQEGRRLVDADPPVRRSRSLPLSVPPGEQVMTTTGESCQFQQRPTPTDTDVVSAPPFAPGVSCPLCQDRGYLRTNAPVAHPQFGKLVACTCTQARVNEARRQRLRDQSKLDELAAFQEEAFESFQFWLTGVGQAYEEAKRFAETPQGWLV